MDQFTLIECPARVKQGQAESRAPPTTTCEDATYIKVGLGHIRISELLPEGTSTTWRT
jgi:hypothetical protein